MKYISPAIKFMILFMIFISFVSCGYKPSSTFARQVVGEKISTSVIISSQDPENTVIIKDAIDSAVIEVFHASLTSRDYSDTHLTISLHEPSYSPIQYDQNGYVISYRAMIQLLITRQTANSVEKYNVKGTYDFSVTANAVITDQERFDAIKYSSKKAINSFLAKVSAEGTRKQN